MRNPHDALTPFRHYFVTANEWDVYGPGGTGNRLEETLAGQMEYEYFPVSLDQLGATLRFHDLGEGTHQIGGARVTAQYMNHPAVTLGYRIEAGGITVVYAVDHEPHSRHQPDAALDARMAEIGVQATDPVHREDRRHIDFLRDADLIIHDAQYSAEEYTGKVGWGHTAAQTAVDFAVGAARLALFHHDPARDDRALSNLEESCRLRATRAGLAGAALQVFAATEGQSIELAETTLASPFTPANFVAPPMSPPAALPAVNGRATSGAALPAIRGTVLIVDDEPQVVRLLLRALKSDQLRLLSAGDGETALRVARAERPDLVLLDWRMPGKDGLDVCRAIRADPDPHLHGVPVVLLTGVTASEDTAAAFDAGATDYLTKPFGMAHVRARVNEWLLRGRTASDPTAVSEVQTGESAATTVGGAVTRGPAPEA